MPKRKRKSKKSRGSVRKISRRQTKRHKITGKRRAAFKARVRRIRCKRKETKTSSIYRLSDGSYVKLTPSGRAFGVTRKGKRRKGRKGKITKQLQFLVDAAVALGYERADVEGMRKFVETNS